MRKLWSRWMSMETVRLGLLGDPLKPGQFWLVHAARLKVFVTFVAGYALFSAVVIAILLVT